MKISIVMAYFNRRNLLLNTLRSISKTEYSNYEVIIVDDASDEDQRLEGYIDNLGIDITLLRVDPQDKKHVNPCIPYNIGFSKAVGDIVIIQNPECYHKGDIISHASKLRSNDYNVYHCYSLPQSETERLLSSSGYVVPLLNRGASFNGDNGYYTHGRLVPRPYHFCSAIFKSDLDSLGGFDERYAYASAYDDDELAVRIKRKGLKFNYIESPMVLHQWHYHSNSNKPIKTNESLFKNVTLSEITWSVNGK
jgi:GT2 family glycosyltransferase